MQLLLFAWVDARRKAAGQSIIAIVGETILSAVNQNGTNNALHLVSALDTDEGMELCQLVINHKGREIEAAKQLIACLEIKDAIVTIDAQHCKKDTLQRLTSSSM